MNRPFLSSPGPLYRNEVKCSAFDMEMNFHSHANKTHLHKKDCALGLILKVRAFGTQKWPPSFLWKGEGDWVEETFAKTTGFVVREMGKFAYC